MIKEAIKMFFPMKNSGLARGKRESFEDYRKRRNETNMATKTALAGNVIWISMIVEKDKVTGLLMTRKIQGTMQLRNRYENSMTKADKKAEKKRNILSKLIASGSYRSDRRFEAC